MKKVNVEVRVEFEVSFTEPEEVLEFYQSKEFQDKICNIKVKDLEHLSELIAVTFYKEDILLTGTEGVENVDKTAKDTIFGSFILMYSPEEGEHWVSEEEGFGKVIVKQGYINSSNAHAVGMDCSPLNESVKHLDFIEKAKDINTEVAVSHAGNPFIGGIKIPMENVLVR